MLPVVIAAASVGLAMASDGSDGSDGGFTPKIIQALNWIHGTPLEHWPFRVFSVDIDGIEASVGKGDTLESLLGEEPHAVTLVFEGLATKPLTPEWEWRGRHNSPWEEPDVEERPWFPGWTPQREYRVSQEMIQYLEDLGVVISEEWLDSNMEYSMAGFQYREKPDGEWESYHKTKPMPFLAHDALQRGYTLAIVFLNPGMSFNFVYPTPEKGVMYSPSSPGMSQRQDLGKSLRKKWDGVPLWTFADYVEYLKGAS